MTKTIHEHATEVLNVSVERDEWDEYPMLWILLDDGKAEDPITILMAMPEGHPADVLEALTRAFDSGSEPNLPPGRLLGVALQTEGWGLRADSPIDTELYMMQGGRISEHPDRFEMKQVTSWDGKELRSVTHRRDGKEVPFLNAGDELEGRVPDVLKKLFATLEPLAHL